MDKHEKLRFFNQEDEGNIIPLIQMLTKWINHNQNLIRGKGR